MNILAFDIETIPDTESGARLYGLGGLADEDIARAMSTRRMQTAGTDFLPLHLHRVVAISVVMRRGRGAFKVRSLGDAKTPERELLAQFFGIIQECTPTLLSWNGGGFDLPVLHYRSLLHSVSAPRYWELGAREREFRFNNYLNRFHWRHIDLMDVLAGFTPRAAAPLDEISSMLGFPGKRGMQGGDVWRAYLDGRIEDIRNYCETDALNTFLIYLRWEVVRGNLDAESVDAEFALMKKHLRESGGKHLAEFVDDWESGDGGGHGDADEKS